MSTVEISTPHSSHQVPEGKLTSLGLYLTAREAYETVSYTHLTLPTMQ